MNLTEAMERVDRCILRYVPDRGWSATDKECADDDELVWRDSPGGAVAWIGRGCRLVLKFTDHEHDVLRAVTDRADRWACEWYRDEWLRPFVAPEPRTA